jgi:hypothetical protein
MLGVLLATARPGQRTPGLGQTVNLAACGLAIRVRRIPGWLAAEAGQDALAVVSLIAPAVVFILLALGWAVNAAAGARVLPRVPVWTPLLPVPVLPFSGESVVVMIAWLAVAVLGLTGRQRTAAKIASISLTLALLALLLVLVVLIQQVHSFYFNTFPGELFQFLPFGDVPVVLASLAACSLALSPGPRRGLAIVGWRRACLMIAGLSAGFGFPAIVQLADPAAPIWDLAFRLLGVLAIAIAVAVAVTRVRGPVGRRVAGLVATGLLPSLAVTIPLRDVPAVFPVPVLVSLFAAVLVWPTAIISWRGRAERRRRLAERDLDFTVVYAEVYAEFQAFCARRDAWQDGRYRRGEISQWPFYGDNPFRPR